MAVSFLRTGFAIACIVTGSAVCAQTTAGAAIHPTEEGYTLPPVRHALPLEANKAGVFGLDHTHIWTADLDRSIKFYTELLGFTVMQPIQDIGQDEWMQKMLGVPGASFRVAMLNIPGGPSYSIHVPTIEIWEVKGIPLDTSLKDNPTKNLQGKGYNSYRVTNLGAIMARLEAAGVEVIGAPIWPSPSMGGVYIVDPDGQLVELDEFDNAPGELSAGYPKGKSSGGK
jgi:catechol 2,3-dioxygenase-like lactoylglutathione lyase family enzyme